MHLARNLGVLRDGKILRMRRGLVELLDIPALARLAGVELAARPSVGAAPRRVAPALAASAMAS